MGRPVFEKTEADMRRTHVAMGVALVATVAIVAPALGGSSLKKLVRKEVAKQVGKLPGGPAGANGAPGAAGTARAYAQVIDDCDLTTGACPVKRSKGVASATRSVEVGAQAGTYCIVVPGVSDDDVPAQTSIDDSNTGATGNQAAAVLYDDQIAACPDTQFVVYTYIGTTPSNNVSFNILIP